MSTDYYKYYAEVLKMIKSLGLDYNKQGRERSTYHLNNEKHLIIRYSQFYEKQQHYFFGIQRKKYELYSAYNLFLLLICGSDENVLVIPGADFYKLVEYVDTASDDNWKFNVKNRDYFFQLWVKGSWHNIHNYLNLYSQLCS